METKLLAFLVAVGTAILLTQPALSEDPQGDDTGNQDSEAPVQPRGDAENDANHGVVEVLEEEPIWCYRCNSVYDGDICHDPMNEAKLAQLPQVKCNASNNEVSCYKLVTRYQSLSLENDADVDEEDREVVVTNRMCGSEDKDDTWGLDGGSSTGNSATRSYCTSDFCNAANVVSTSRFALIGSFLLVVFRGQSCL